MSIAIARTVLTAVSMSAPALTATLAKSTMFVTLGDNFTITGFLASVLTLEMTSSSSLGFCPISDPVSRTCGQDTFSSTASAPASIAFLATSA